MVWGPNVQHATLLFDLNLVTTALSLVGSSSMAYFCYRSMGTHSVALKFIFAIAVSDFFYTTSNVMSAFEDDTNGILCHTEAFVRQLFYQICIYLTAGTSLLCYKTVTLGKSFNQEGFFRSTLLLATCVGLFFNVLPLFFHEIRYQNGDVFCWIASTGGNTFLPVTIDLFYGAFPVCIGLSVSIYAYARAILTIKRLPQELVGKMDISIYKLLWYPLVLFLIFTPSVIHGFIMIYFKKQQTIGMEATYLVLTHSIGFINAILYGLQRNLYNLGIKKRNSTGKFGYQQPEEEDSVDESLIKAGRDSMC